MASNDQTGSSARLAGKVALVTGASKGIGAGIARHLAKAGAAVVVNYASSKAGADNVVADITAAGGRAIAVQGDVSKESDIKRLFADAKAAFGTIDVLVNNAGIYGFASLAEITGELFDRQFGLNVRGLLLASREAAAQFPATGGSIINISSAATSLAPPTAAVYTATKAAVDSLTRVLSKELGSRNIRVNSLSPGMVETEGTSSAGITGTNSDFEKWAISTTPLGRVGQVDDIGPVAVFLASDDARWVTGEVLFASGGAR